MAITPISNRYKGFIFAGENSRNYGVYITEPAVFGSPERDVEMVSVAGRNGDYIIDNGRYNNIEVVYNCALPAESDSDFIDGVSAFRNMLSSRIGYQRLTDEINANEYREGAFVAGLDVDTLNVEAGTFSVRFNCKPQRFLTSGETAVELNNGEEITNPTAYDARPLLQIWGYGEFTVGGDTLEIVSAPIGTVRVMADESYLVTVSRAFALDLAPLENGDTFGGRIRYNYECIPSLGYVVTSTNPSWGTVEPTFTKGVAGSYPFTMHQPFKTSDGNQTYTGAFDTSWSVIYDGDSTLTVSYTVTQNTITGATVEVGIGSRDWFGNSTKSALGSPIYIDMDIGEAYKIEGGVPISVNNAVTIPAVLPTLPEGATEVTFDNTITKFEIVPRWWLL